MQPAHLIKRLLNWTTRCFNEDESVTYLVIICFFLFFFISSFSFFFVNFCTVSAAFCPCLNNNNKLKKKTKKKTECAQRNSEKDILEDFAKAYSLWPPFAKLFWWTSTLKGGMAVLITIAAHTNLPFCFPLANLWAQRLEGLKLGKHCIFVRIPRWSTTDAEIKVGSLRWASEAIRGSLF